MKLLYFLIVLIFLLSSCIQNRIYKQYDDFENQKKYKLEQVYYAKKDFSGSTQVKITYYKTVSQTNDIQVDALLMVHSSSEKGKLQEKISFRIENKIYEAVFYDYQANYDYNYSIDYDDESIGANQNFSGNADEDIRNLAYFDLSAKMIDEISKAPNLQIRFYIGKEAYTIQFSKAKLKQFKKFLLL